MAELRGRFLAPFFFRRSIQTEFFRNLAVAPPKAGNSGQRGTEFIVVGRLCNEGVGAGLETSFNFERFIRGTQDDDGSFPQLPYTETEIPNQILQPNNSALLAAVFLDGFRPTELA